MIEHLELLRHDWKERLIRAIVWRLPHSIVMWAYVRVAAHATSGEYSDTHPNEIGLMDALDRWTKTPLRLR